MKYGELKPAIGPIKPEVSDHAVLRWLEHTKGINVEAARRKILTPSMKGAIRAGAASLKTPVGRFVIRGHVVATFVPKDRTPGNRRNKGKQKER